MGFQIFLRQDVYFASQADAGQPTSGVVGTSEAPFLPNYGDAVLTAMSPVLSGYITTIRIWPLDEEITGVGFVKLIAEFFPPAVLFSSGLHALSTIRSELRNQLDKHGANLTQNPYHRILMTLVTNLNEDEDDANVTVDAVQTSLLQVVVECL